MQSLPDMHLVDESAILPCKGQQSIATTLTICLLVEAAVFIASASISAMIRKLKSGQYRIYSRKKNDSTGKRRNLGTFSTFDQAKHHEREIQFFK